MSHLLKNAIPNLPQFFCNDRWLSAICYIFKNILEKQTHFKKWVFPGGF